MVATTAALLALLPARVVLGHGALSGDADTCTLAIGPFKMHFTGYQPTESGNQEFCEDIPATGQTIIVLESMDAQLRDMQVAAQIVSQAEGEGVVLDQPFRSNARGSITLMHTFPVKGGFVGLVTVRGDETEYVAEFPFSVGLPPAATEDAPPAAGIPAGAWIAIVAVAAVALAAAFWVRRRSRSG